MIVGCVTELEAAAGGEEQRARRHVVVAVTASIAHRRLGCSSLERFRRGQRGGSLQTKAGIFKKTKGYRKCDRTIPDWDTLRDVGVDVSPLARMGPCHRRQKCRNKAVKLQKTKDWDFFPLGISSTAAMAMRK
jgi:hypothetical protein